LQVKFNKKKKGITFVFPIPEKHREYENKAPEDFPMEFPDGTTPITSNIFVYQGHDYENPVLPPLNSVKMQDGNVYFEEVFVKLGKSITFMSRNKTIEFGYSPQDVISEIGPPEEIYYRHDKRKIHAFAKH